MLFAQEKKYLHMPIHIMHIMLNSLHAIIENSTE